jgi:thiamine biosynthesis lipoprotein
MFCSSMIRGFTWATVVAWLALTRGANAGEPRVVSYPGRTMGTYSNILLVTGDSAASAPLARLAHATFAREDSLMSNWTTTSEVARINREAYGQTVRVDPEVARVIAYSLEVWRGSQHTFDITVEPLIRAWGFLGGKPHVPSDAEIASAFRRVGAAHLRFDPGTRTLRFDRQGLQIDLGGIAKGYAVHVVAESLRAHGVRDALVDLSGNMDAIGHPPGAPYWRIGIRDPRDRMPFFARLDLTDQGVSTSADYEQFVISNGKRYGHIMDPRTGRPAEGLLAVTVVAKNGYITDAWDTPLFVLGAAEAKRIAKARDDIAAIIVEPGADGVDTVWVEQTLRSRFHIEPDAAKLFHVVEF